jgi:hypothetical protein
MTFILGVARRVLRVAFFSVFVFGVCCAAGRVFEGCYPDVENIVSDFEIIVLKKAYGEITQDEFKQFIVNVNECDFLVAKIVREIVILNRLIASGHDVAAYARFALQQKQLSRVDSYNFK